MTSSSYLTMEDFYEIITVLEYNTRNGVELISRLIAERNDLKTKVDELEKLK